MYYTNLIIIFRLSSRTYCLYGQSPFLDTCVFVNQYTSNKFEDLNEFKLSKMIENIKLKLIYIIERILFCILESLRAEMHRKQPL